MEERRERVTSYQHETFQRAIEYSDDGPGLTALCASTRTIVKVYYDPQTKPTLTWERLCAILTVVVYYIKTIISLVRVI